MNSYNSTELTLEHIPNELISINAIELQLVSQYRDLASVDESFQRIEPVSNVYTCNITIEGKFLGRSEIYVRLRKPGTIETQQAVEKLHVIVSRQKRMIDHIFGGTMALLIAIILISFGAVLEMETVKKILLKPVGPAIGFCGQYLFMPLIAFGLGNVLLLIVNLRF